MFESGVAPDASAEFQAAADRAFSILRTATEHVLAERSPKSSAPSLMVALHIWSLTHGIASLFGRADEARRKIPMSAEDLLEAGILVYLQGLDDRDGDS